MLTAAGAATDDLLLRSLMMEKEAFWLNNNHLAKAEIERKWDVRAAQIRSILDPSPPPPLNLRSPVPQPPWCDSQYTLMGRSRSDQPAPRSLDRSQALSCGPPSMSRKRSNGAENNARNERHVSPLITNYQSSGNDPWTMPSPSKIQRTASGRQSLAQVPEVAVYDPGEYVKQNNAPPFHTSLAARPQRPRRMSHHLSISPSKASPLNGSFASSSPSSMSNMTDATTVVSMSRQHSQATNSLCGGLDMVHIRSQHSHLSDSSMGEDPNMVESLLSGGKAQFPSFDQSHFVDHAGGIVQDYGMFPDDLHVDLPVALPDATPSGGNQEVGMDRSASSESNSSSASSASKRRHKQKVLSKRLLAPKLSEEQLSLAVEPSSSGHQVMRIRSADGLVKNVMPISKQQCTRPQREKIRCDKCNSHAEGFRGEHELRRHIERRHSTRRRVWVCVDASPDKSMLAKCKACCQNKMYGADYNAAAHLRRVHFNPKRKGRNNKGTVEEKRGGKGGGDYPPMDVLKKSWMKETDEYVPDNDVLGNDVSDDDDSPGTTARCEGEDFDSEENEWDVIGGLDSSLPPTTSFADQQASAAPTSELMPTPSFLDYGGALVPSSQSGVVASTPDISGSYGLSMIDADNMLEDLLFDFPY